jgi:hypothetical protein
MLLRHVASRRIRTQLPYSRAPTRIQLRHCSSNIAIASPFLHLTRSGANSRAAQSHPSSWHHHVQKRTAKRKTVIDLDDIPQGAIQIDVAKIPLEDDEPDYPPLLQQVRNNMLKFSHCVVLTRVGGFYELYFEHAEEYAPLLNIKRSRKRPLKGSKRPAVPMVSDLLDKTKTGC